MSAEDMNHLDKATVARLGRLRGMPVDTSRLEKMVRGRIGRPARAHVLSMRSLRTLAASIVILIGLVGGIILSTSSEPVLASPAQMARVYQDMVDGRMHMMKVDSIEEAEKLLGADAPQGADLPHAPDEYVMACCMKSIKNKKVACVLMRDEVAPILMSVASAEDMKMPKSPTVVREGNTYYVESFEKLNMVSTQREGRWICLMGQTSAERLIELAGKLRF